MNFDATEACARRLDGEDSLAAFRDRFIISPGTIYLDGNSLGLVSVDAEQALAGALSDWKILAIDAYTGAPVPWIALAETLGARQAPLVGAGPDEVVVTGGTTINLHAMLAAFYRPSAGRRKILADRLNFPSDLYALSSQVALRGGDPRSDLVFVESREGLFIEEDDIIAAMADDVALALFPGVYYKSGQLLDIERVAREARQRDIIAGFDCSHSVGAVPHRFDEWNVDWAVWCNYKYLNGGPGAVASLYVNRRLFGTAPGLAGWFGNDRATMFDMGPDFDPAPDANAFQIGSTPILSSAPLLGSLQMIEEAGIERLREKWVRITSYLFYLIDELLSGEPYRFAVASPRDPARRGGHVAVTHPEAWRITAALKKRRVVGDFRPPDIIRLAPVPLYVRYEDVWTAVQHLKSVIDNGEHEALSADRGIVT
jgi:kynureninase